ncbi:MAG: hypothetical protein KAI66_02850, partial [Lentisphaeria bacterium]|nr:hypothetical protein [Lentisphaeria bacterium]
MLAENLSEMMENDESGHGHSHETMGMLWALFGGLLVLNSYLANRFFATSIDSFAVESSAVVGALILSFPVFRSALKDLVKGKIYMNELVALALIAAFSAREYRVAGAVAFFMLVTITIERRTARGAEASIEALIRLTPKKARRIVDGQEE